MAYDSLVNLDKHWCCLGCQHYWHAWYAGLDLDDPLFGLKISAAVLMKVLIGGTHERRE